MAIGGYTGATFVTACLLMMLVATRGVPGGICAVGAAAVRTAQQSVRDLRIAEVVQLDLVVGDANFNGTLAEAVASMEAVANRCRLKP